MMSARQKPSHRSAIVWSLGLPILSKGFQKGLPTSPPGRVRLTDSSTKNIDFGDGILSICCFENDVSNGLSQLRGVNALHRWQRLRTAAVAQ
jgi:hypothetical protein